MCVKFFLNKLKNIFKVKNEAAVVPEEKHHAPHEVSSEPVCYDLVNGVNDIRVKGISVQLIAVIPKQKSIRLIVDPDGKINLYNKGGCGLEFNTEQDLFINFVENDNTKFKLKSGMGHDKIIIQENVVLDELHGNDGNDEIINNGIVYNIYGGAGDDVILNNGITCSIYGEVGNDTVVNNGMVSKYIDVGEDNDHVINNAEVGRYILGGDGTDKLVNNGNIAWSMTEGFENITGEVNGILYIDGKKFSGIYEKNNLMYHNGILLTGISPIDNKNYEKGREVE